MDSPSGWENIDGRLMKALSDIEASGQRQAAAEFKIKELEAKVSELEEERRASQEKEDIDG